MIRIGIIGLDTSHAVQFTRTLNQQHPPTGWPASRIVAAYPWGSREIVSSAQRIPGYRAEVESSGVVIVDSIAELLTQVDAVLLETNDGRLHLEQVLPVLQAGKPAFVDKPIAASLADVIAIYRLAEHFQTAIFSSSALRFTPGVQQLIAGELGEITACDTYSPCPVETTHPDLFWYGIHGVELLFSVMGTGCVAVNRLQTTTCDFVSARWDDGRIGTFRGRRDAAGGYLSGFGGTAFGSRGIRPMGSFIGYEVLLKEIVQFFSTGRVPVSPEETLEIYTFMSAAQACLQQPQPVLLADIRLQAEQQAAEILRKTLADQRV